MLHELKRYQISCDTCGRGAGEPRESRTEAISAAARQFWQLHSTGAVQHICPQCLATDQADTSSDQQRTKA